MKNAQIAIERVLSIKCFPKIAKATDLKWLRTGQKIWPVFVNNDPSNAQLVNVKQGNKQVIEYIGNRLIDKATIQAVSARNLKDYHNDDQGGWSSDSMASYMKQLKRCKPFVDKRGQEQQRMILEEEFFLDLLLKKQIELDKKASEDPVGNNGDDSEDDDDSDKEKFYKYKATVAVTPPTPTPPKASVPLRILTDAEMKAQYRKLRAGDIIEYVHPVFKNQRHRAMILKATPPKAQRKNCNDVVLYLSDGMALPRESEVRLLKRYLRGNWVENTGSVTIFLWDFKFDTSLNGKFKESDFETAGGEKSIVAKIRDAYDEAKDQVEQKLMKLASRDPDNTEAEEEQKCGEKRTLTEANALTSPETKRRTSARRKLST